MLSYLIRKRFDRISDQPCSNCGTHTTEEKTTLNVYDPPPFIAFHLEDTTTIPGGSVCQPKLTATVSIGEKDNKIIYNTRGLVYWDKTHFTCRLIDKSREVYYNDGMTTGTSCIHEGRLSELQDIYRCHNRQLTYVILSLI